MDEIELPRSERGVSGSRHRLTHQPDVRGVCTVVIGKDRVGQIEHARREAARGKELEQRLLGQRTRRALLAELLKGGVHCCELRPRIRLGRMDHLALLTKIVVVGPLELDDRRRRTAVDALAHQLEQPVAALT